MDVEQIKEKWETYWKKGELLFIPEENARTEFQVDGISFEMSYVPARSKRGKKADNSCPWDYDLSTHYLFIDSYGGFTLVANYYPIEMHHMMLLSNSHKVQNDFNYQDIMDITRYSEDSGIRSFLNLLGTAATYEHLHAQSLGRQFVLEKFPLIELGNNERLMQGYPIGHVIVHGSPEQRSDLLFEKIEKLSNSGLHPTIRRDGSLCEKPLYTLLFWEDNILLVPRRYELPPSAESMFGGLEMSCSFCIANANDPANPFNGYTSDRILNSIKEAGVRPDEARFLHNGGKNVTTDRSG